MNTDSEIWKPVVGYEGAYEVSSLGRIRTVERQVSAKAGSVRTVKPRIRIPCFVNGYYGVKLSHHNKSKTEIVHRMVLEAFVGPRPSAMHDACHWDGVKTNNSISNLRWGTKKENKEDAFRQGVAPIGEKVANSKLKIEFVMSVFGDSRSGAEIARAASVNRSTINKIRAGKTWSKALEQVAYG
jgi:NUMOD4 motif/HNH endonuclease